MAIIFFIQLQTSPFILPKYGSAFISILFQPLLLRCGHYTEPSNCTVSHFLPQFFHRIIQNFGQFRLSPNRIPLNLVQYAQRIFNCRQMFMDQATHSSSVLKYSKCE